MSKYSMIRRVYFHPRFIPIHHPALASLLSTSTTTSSSPPSKDLSISQSSSVNLDPLTKDKALITTAEYVNAFSDLSKAKLSALVVCTSTFGFLAATSAAATISFPTLAAVSLGTALCSSSASTLNQIFERDRDAKMKRTAQRPLVTQTIVNTPHAWTLALTTGTSGAITLYIGTDPVTTALGIGNILLYSGIYTFMKPRTEWNTWIGAIVGAIPPIMGYTAATAGAGIFDIQALLLGSTLFLWQFPHFLALSWMHRVDYGRGGFQMIATTDTPNGDNTSRLIMKYTWYLSAIPFATSALEVTSSMFMIDGCALNAYALYVAKCFDDDRSNGNARKVFLTSLWYLPCWMMLFLLHSNTWKEVNEEEEVGDDNFLLRWIRFMQEKTADIRETGRQLCLHEIALNRNDTAYHDEKNLLSRGSELNHLDTLDQATLCPVVFGKSKLHHASEKLHAGVSVTDTNA
jgi:protoheme IX farnesyltransferase